MCCADQTYRSRYEHPGGNRLYARLLEKGAVVAENGVPEQTLQDLKEEGYKVICAKAPHGGAQAIWIDWERENANPVGPICERGLALA